MDTHQNARPHGTDSMRPQGQAEYSIDAASIAFNSVHVNNETNLVVAEGEMVAHALSYARRNWAVFPCGKDKRPLTLHGFKDAANSEEQIRAWWRKWPTASIGCATGSSMGAFVLDVDLPTGPATLAALEAEHGPLPLTVEQRTGGGGRHLFFMMPEGLDIRNSTSKVGLNLDVRGNGGYVVLPPSGHKDGGMYEWLENSASLAEAPAWLIELVMAKAKPKDKAREQAQQALSNGEGRRSGATTRYGQKALGAECAKVAASIEGTRNEKLNRCAFRVGQLVGGGEIDCGDAERDLLNAAIAAGLEEPEATKTLLSGLEAGIREPRRSSELSTGTGSAAETEAEAGSEPKKPSPGKFSLRKDGVYFAVSKDGCIAWEWVCSPLHVLALTRDGENREWGRLLEITDAEGRAHRWAMPARLLAATPDLVGELLSFGLVMDSSQKGRQRLIEYLAQTKPGVFARCVNRPGWHDGLFVLPDAVYGYQGNEIVVLQGGPADHAFRVAGNLVDWQDGIGKYCVQNSRLVLAVSSALAAALLQIVGAESGGIHIFGQSSTGKTTALHVAGSVCGGGGLNGYVRQWRATVNGIEGVAAQHSDCLLCFDEIGQADPKDVAGAAYMIANGRGKDRADKTGNARKALEWRVLFLSTGELTLEDRLKEDARAGTHKAGQGVRVVDVPACTPGGFGIFENLHGFASGDALARHLKDTCGLFYGTPLRAFLEALTSDLDNAQVFVKGVIKEFCAANTPRSVDGQVSRVAARFALIAAAGELGVKYGVIPWPPGAATKGAAACFKAWLEHRGCSGPSELDRGCREVVRFFQTQHRDRFENIEARADAQDDYVNKVRDLAGFYRKDLETEGLEFFVYPEVFKQEICRGFDPRSLARELIARAMLLPDSGNKSTKPQKLPGHSDKTRVYHFSPKVLEGLGTD